jgi:hypothetical protein
MGQHAALQQPHDRSVDKFVAVFSRRVPRAASRRDRLLICGSRVVDEQLDADGRSTDIVWAARAWRVRARQEQLGSVNRQPGHDSLAAVDPPALHRAEGRLVELDRR